MSHFILTSHPFVFFVALVVLLYFFIPNRRNEFDPLFGSEKMDVILPPLIGISIPIGFVILATLLTLETPTVDTTQSDIAQSSVSAVVGQSGQ